MRWFLVLALAGCVSVPPASGVVVIANDGGGRLIEYEARRKSLAKAERVEIRGKCMSACTIFYSLPNACVGRGATFGFHSASVSLGPIGDRQMSKYYRGEIRRRYDAEWRHSDVFAMIPARDLVKLDPRARLCE